MANNRIFYACQAVGISPFQSSPAWTTVRGVQSVGVNTKFNLEQVFEIGQLAIYENIENLPDCEITMEKVLDGYPLIYHLATQGAPSTTLVGRSNQRAHVALSIFTDTGSIASGTANMLSQCIMSGVYLSQSSFDFMIEGNFKEAATLVGNNKGWLTSAFTFDGFDSTNGVTNLSPAAASGVNRRWNMVMSGCKFPTDIFGINVSGKNVATSGNFSVSFQTIKVSANLGRDMMLELGHRGPYFRYVNFPVEVSSSFEFYAKNGDLFSCSEEGIYTGANDLTPQAIRIEIDEGTHIDLGAQNKCSSINYGGANAGSRGGNATITQTYVTYNDYTITHPADPAAFPVGF